MKGDIFIDVDYNGLGDRLQIDSICSELEEIAPSYLNLY